MPFIFFQRALDRGNVIIRCLGRPGTNVTLARGEQDVLDSAGPARSWPDALPGGGRLSLGLSPRAALSRSRGPRQAPPVGMSSPLQSRPHAAVSMAFGPPFRSPSVEDALSVSPAHSLGGPFREELPGRDTGRGTPWTRSETCAWLLGACGATPRRPHPETLCHRPLTPRDPLPPRRVGGSDSVPGAHTLSSRRGAGAEALRGGGGYKGRTPSPRRQEPHAGRGRALGSGRRGGWRHRRARICGAGDSTQMCV